MTESEARDKLVALFIRILREGRATLQVVMRDIYSTHHLNDKERVEIANMVIEAYCK